MRQVAPRLAALMPLPIFAAFAAQSDSNVAGSHANAPAATAVILAEPQWRPTLNPTPAYAPIKWPSCYDANGQEVPVPPEGEEFPLMQVYLSNSSETQTIELSKVFLDGIELGKFREHGLIYWQFSPCAILAPKAAGVELQICFVKKPQKPQSLEIEIKSGARIRAALPPFAEPDLQIIGLTWRWDFRKLYVAYQAPATTAAAVTPKLAPAKLTVNGADLTNMARLLDLPNTETPGMLAVELPSPAKQGQPFHVRLQTQDGQVSQAIVRASRGVFVDSFSVDEKDEKLRKELGLDLRPFSKLIGADPACSDQMEYGKSLTSMLATRKAWYDSGDDRLCHDYACIPTRPEVTCRIYGQALDGLQMNAYSLQWARVDDPMKETRWLEQEENFFRWGHLAARPKLLFWIPECFVQHSAKFTTNNRIIEPAELRSLTYGALGHGMRGLTYYEPGTIGKLSYETGIGFLNSKPLVAEIKRLNAEIKRLEPLLSSSYPVAIETIGDKDRGIRLYTLWCGDEGLLWIARSLDYTTDREPNELAAKPRFNAPPKENVEIKLRKPPWLTVGAVVDPFDPAQAPIPHQAKDGMIHIALPQLDLMKVGWIANAAAVQKISRQ